MAGTEYIGKIVHFFPKPSVAVLELEGILNVGDMISIEMASGSFEQKVESMQIEHENIQEAKPGQSIGLKVLQVVKAGSKVYKVLE